MSVGLLILRLVVGGLIFGHGAQKLFGWFGGHGPDGTGGFFHSIGFRPGRPMAQLAGLTEIAAGASLVFGFLTPLGAAMLIGMMITAGLAVHWPNGLWNTEGGYELPLVNAAAGVCLAFTGAGRLSIDHAIGLNALHGWATGIGACALALLTSVPLLVRRSSQQRRAAAAPYPVEEPAATDVGIDITR